MGRDVGQDVRENVADILATLCAQYDTEDLLATLCAQYDTEDGLTEEILPVHVEGNRLL